MEILKKQPTVKAPAETLASVAAAAYADDRSSRTRPRADDNAAPPSIIDTTVTRATSSRAIKSPAPPTARA
jgi:hypothetical protein